MLSPQKPFIATPIPVNIIGGHLGSGKTTTINHILTLKPPEEYWSILINEYGLIGIDGALIENKSQQNNVDIKEVAGGCICCSAGLMFEVSLVRLLQRRPDRLLIEPTGLASLSGIIETLSRPGIQESIDLRSIICLLDPARLKDMVELETVQDQIDAADIILASRSDLASQEQLEQFDSFATSLFPKKLHSAHIVQGQVPFSLLDRVSNRKTSFTRLLHHHGTEHPHDEPISKILCDVSNPIVRRVHHSTAESTFGWICWNGLIFDAVEADKWLNRIAKLSTSLRTKAVIRTNEGWWKFNFVNQVETLQPSGYRRDSRIEVIIEGTCDELIEQFELELRACLINESTPT